MKYLSCLIFACLGLVVSAQTSSLPRVDARSKIFRLDGGDATYVMGVDADGMLQTIYWGKHLPTLQTFAIPKPDGGMSLDMGVTTSPYEFAGWGSGLHVEPGLKVTFPDGNRDLVLKYVSDKVATGELQILMKDISRDVYVTLQYRMDQETGILRRAAGIENRTSAPLLIEDAAAGTYNLPRGTDYRLHYVTGRWAGEWNVQEQPLRGGKTILESRRGTTGMQNNPWIMIDHGTDHDQDQGDVWFAALGWSGSWQIVAEQDTGKGVHITGGPNTFDFSYDLENGATFQTPYFYGGFSNHGLGGASQLLHRFEVNSLLPHAPTPKLRPVLYNSWEATTFHVDEAGQMALAEKAASIGVERFVMDDGWFGQRKTDHAGLGDWYVDPQKFPRGLKPLIDKVHTLNMDFGLWVEPEMVNPDSDLYREHPDWVLNFPGRPRTETRNQLVLNLARQDVHDYVLHFLDQLLSENDIAFLKWDYNRNWSEPGWPDVPPEQQKNVYIDFTRNYYDILDKLREKHPKLEIETCSSGGGRVDLGVLGLTDQAWTSDNTDAYDRLLLQEGFTYAYSPGVMMAWVTDSPTWMNKRTLSLSYRFLSAMQGALGIGADLNKWAAADFVTARTMVADYKSIRETVQRGELYRLMSPREGEQAVTETVSRDGKQAVAFAFLHSSTQGYPFPRVYLRGLKEEASYKLDVISGKAKDGTPSHATGGYWMHYGIDLALRGDFQAVAIRLDRE